MRARLLSNVHRPYLRPRLRNAALALLDGRAALEEIEAEAIRFAITHYGGRMSEVARRLRIGRSTLYRKLDSLGRDAAISDPKTPAW